MTNNRSDEEHITISTWEYDSLLKKVRLLNALENFGVDNWEWYGDAIDTLEDVE